MKEKVKLDKDFPSQYMPLNPCTYVASTCPLELHMLSVYLNRQQVTWVYKTFLKLPVTYPPLEVFPPGV